MMRTDKAGPDHGGAEAGHLVIVGVERETGIEPATFSLEG